MAEYEPKIFIATHVTYGTEKKRAYCSTMESAEALTKLWVPREISRRTECKIEEVTLDIEVEPIVGEAFAEDDYWSCSC